MNDGDSVVGSQGDEWKNVRIDICFQDRQNSMSAGFTGEREKQMLLFGRNEYNTKHRKVKSQQKIE